MNIIRFNPPGSPTPKNYHHVVSVEGGRTVYFAGQVAFDEHRNIVGGSDLIAQTHQALSNLKRNVEAAGASMTDMVKITTYVVNYDPRQLQEIIDVIGEYFPEGHHPTNTLLGVERLAVDELLIEIEGIAVTDKPLTRPA
jgi:enamine deaminase RidA (YjgF/YER057c/UK114 family)